MQREAPQATSKRRRKKASDRTEGRFDLDEMAKAVADVAANMDSDLASKAARMIEEIEALAKLIAATREEIRRIARFLGVTYVGYYSIGLMSKGYVYGIINNLATVTIPHMQELYGKRESIDDITKLYRGSGAEIAFSNDPGSAVEGADIVYTDVWISMGQEGERKKRLKGFKGFQVNKGLLAKAKKGCKIMHCMPAHRGEEITSDVIDSRDSIVLDQAENRLHVQKAILYLLLKK